MEAIHNRGSRDKGKLVGQKPPLKPKDWPLFGIMPRECSRP